MMDYLKPIFVDVFNGNSWLATIIIAMFPLFELKGAIPIGMSVDFWGENVLNGSQAFLCGLIGSCLVVPFLALLFNPIINGMKKTKIFGKLACFLQNKVQKSSTKILNDISATESKKRAWAKFFGVLLFVAIPLPLTGVWTGTCVGVALGLRFWQVVLSVVIGNIIAGFLITCVCSIFPQFTTIIFLIVLAIILVVCLVGLFKYFINKSKKQL